MVSTILGYQKDLAESDRVGRVLVCISRFISNYPTSAHHVFKIAKQLCVCSMYLIQYANLTFLQIIIVSSPKGTRIIQTRKTSERKAESRESSIVILPAEGGFPKRISIETKTNRLSLGEAMDSMDQKVNQEVKQSIDTTNVPPTVPEENDECTISDFGILGIPRCTSPTQDLRCTGDSECINSPVLRPHVVSSGFDN